MGVKFHEMHHPEFGVGIQIFRLTNFRLEDVKLQRLNEKDEMMGGIISEEANNSALGACA